MSGILSTGWLEQHRVGPVTLGAVEVVGDGHAIRELHTIAARPTKPELARTFARRLADAGELVGDTLHEALADAGFPPTRRGRGRGGCGVTDRSGWSSHRLRVRIAPGTAAGGGCAE